MAGAFRTVCFQMKRLPTLFLSHGSPMHAIAPGEAGRVWAALGQTLKPRAVLVASAHWETAVPMVTGSPKPQTIHDFGGFPAELYEIQYPARGAPELAEEIVGLLKQAGITAGIDGCRGLDHGAWVPLRHMFPVADVPIVQISVQPERGTAHHVELGRALAPLAAKVARPERKVEPAPAAIPGKTPGRIEIEPEEGEFGKILKRPGE